MSTPNWRVLPQTTNVYVQNDMSLTKNTVDKLKAAMVSASAQTLIINTSNSAIPVVTPFGIDTTAFRDEISINLPPETPTADMLFYPSTVTDGLPDGMVVSTIEILCSSTATSSSATERWAIVWWSADADTTAITDPSIVIHAIYPGVASNVAIPIYAAGNNHGPATRVYNHVSCLGWVEMATLNDNTAWTIANTTTAPIWARVVGRGITTVAPS